MISRIIPRALRRLNIFKIASLINPPRFSFAYKKQYREENNQNAQQEKIYIQEQQTSNWTQNYDEIVSDYPFYSVPIGIIRNPTKFPFNEDQIRNLVAFKAIRALPDDVKLAADILLPEVDQRQFQPTDGRSLFSHYMAKKFSHFIKSLNKANGSYIQRLSSLIILNNVYKDVLNTERVKKIDSNAIINQDDTGVLLALYVQLLARHGLEYTQFLQIILEKLEDNTLPAQVRLKIAKAIFLTPNFEEHYSSKILDSAINVATLNIGKMHNYELLFIIRNVYNYNTVESKRFAESIQNYLIQKHVDDNSLDFHIPLVLKTVRYCYRLGIPTKILLQFIINNMKRFQVIFDRKRISKGVFFNLLFAKTGKQVSPELVGHLKKYFYEGLSHFIQSKQSQSNQILRFNKLLLKYFDYLTEKQQEYFRDQYMQKMIPYYSSSNEALFYSILVYLRVKNIQQGKETLQIQLKQQESLKKYIQLFLQRCCKTNNADQMSVHSNINEVIQMVYQIYRHGLKFNRHELPHICKYDFSQKDSLKPQILNYFFYYLIKTQHEKKQTIKTLLQGIQPMLENFIRKDKVNSFKTILCIIDVCDRVSFQHDFFYKAIENALVNFLMKSPKFVILEKDLKFLNQKLIKRGYGSMGLKNLIIESLQRPRNWENLRRAYLDNQREFRQKIEMKRKQQRYNRPRQ